MEGSQRSERPRCPRHNLALSPAGECVVCRRDSAARDAQLNALDGASVRPLPMLVHSQAPSGAASKIITALLALGMLLAGGFAFRTYQASVTTAMLASSDTSGFGARRGVPKATSSPTTQEPNAAPVKPVQPVAVVVGPTTDPSAQPSAQEPAAIAPPKPPITIQAMPLSDDRQHEEIMAAIAARERARLTKTVTITMYSTSWCGACKRARAYMQKQGIAFIEHDVDRNPEARAQQLTLNPAGSVPTIDVGGHEVMVGFSAKHLDEAIARSVAKRAGS